MTFGYWVQADGHGITKQHATNTHFNRLFDVEPICRTRVSGSFQWCGQGDACMMLRYVTCKRCKRLLERK